MIEKQSSPVNERGFRLSGGFPFSGVDDSGLDEERPLINDVVLE